MTDPCIRMTDVSSDTCNLCADFDSEEHWCNLYDEGIDVPDHMTCNSFEVIDVNTGI